MSSAAEHRSPIPTDSEAILNALPNPVLLVAPDGRIVDANMAAESFFEISTQFLNAPPPRKRAAIVGGTGAYRGARGQAVIVEGPHQTGTVTFSFTR